MLLTFIGNDYPDIHHSLDVWHKAKKLKKELGEVCITRFFGLINKFLLGRAVERYGEIWKVV